MTVGRGVLSVVNRHFPKVSKVEEAKHPVLIEVTKEDVKRSKRKNMNECAMAVACKREFKADGVIMARSVAYLIKEGLAIRFRVPPSVYREITSFDRGGTFEPGQYQDSIPAT